MKRLIISSLLCLVWASSAMADGFAGMELCPTGDTGNLLFFAGRKDSVRLGNHRLGTKVGLWCSPGNEIALLAGPRLSIFTLRVGASMGGIRSRTWIFFTLMSIC